MKITLVLLSLLATMLLQGQSGKIEVEQPVYLDSDTISGTLLMDFPVDSKKIKKAKLIIIIPGSGPTDRNGNSMMVSGANDAYKLLADSLLLEGFATYRYDKLGIGQSSTVKDEAELSFSSNVDVLKAIYTSMSELGFKNIYLAGHSEGALIASMAAQELSVEGLILLAGAGRTFLEVIDEQLSQQLSGDIYITTMSKLDSIKQGYSVENKNVFMESLLRKSIQPYLREMLNLDPSVELSKVKVPILIISGEADMQVKVSDFEKLKLAKPEAKAILYPKMNHVLKVVESPQQNQAAYTDADFPLQPKLASDIAAWAEGL